MLKLEAITKDAQIAGLDPNGIARVVSIEPVGMDVVGQLVEQMALRTNQARLGWVLPMPVADSNAQPAPHNGCLCSG
jgi:hypothetical protein